MSDRNGIFDRTERLVGKSVMEHLADIRVLVVGVGGVGSWCAEGLVRSGVCRRSIPRNRTTPTTNKPWWYCYLC